MRGMLVLGSIWALINGIFWIAGIVILFALVLGGWFRMFKLCGHPHPWAAFVPVYNWIVMCDCCSTDEVNIIGNITFPMKVLKWGWIPVSILMLIIPAIILPFIVVMLLIVGWMFAMIFANIKGTNPDDEVVLGYLCVTNPVLLLIMMYKIEPVDSQY